MASKGTFDVKLLPMEEHSDGTPNPHAAFGQSVITLCDLIGSGTDEVSVITSFYKFRSIKNALVPEYQLPLLCKMSRN